jgi:hypothetical protein
VWLENASRQLGDSGISGFAKENIYNLSMDNDQKGFELIGSAEIRTDKRERRARERSDGM